MKRNATAPYNNRPFKKPRTVSTQTVVAREVAKQMARKSDYKQTLQRDIAAVGIPNTGYTLDLLNALSRGDNGVNNFEGSSIDVKSLKIRCHTIAQDGTQCMRIIVYQWFDAASPAPGDILSTTSLGTVTAPLSPRAWPTTKYRILHDELFQLQNTATFVGGNGTDKVSEIFVPGKKIQRIEFNQGTAVPQKGGLYLLAVSDSAALNHPALYSAWEMVFTD